MTRNILLAVCCFVWASILAAERPNVIVILTDDQGWGDLSIHGNTVVNTPNIDRLAREGAQFDRFYVSPVCSPTRAEFLTGRHHTRLGIYDTSEGAERCNADETMIGEFFKKAGYSTAAFGKWHNGMQYPYHPNARGFDEFYGFCSGHWGDYFSPMLEHNNEMVQGNGFIVDDFTDKALEYMEQNRSDPFFIYLPYNTPHSPMQVPKRWWNKYKDKELTQDFLKKKLEKADHTRAALAMCDNIDWNVGRLLDKLQELQLAENTIVIFFCDNGPNGERWNGGMRGRKGSTDEGGVRSPMFVRWPAKIQAGKMIPQISSVMDLLPTLAEAAGIDLTGNRPLDGISLMPLLLGDLKDWESRTLVHHWEGRVSVRTQQYRLDHNGNLYDIDADPGQKSAINSEEPELLESLQEVADDFSKTMLNKYGKEFDNRPFIVGHPNAIRTQVPARDGIAHGGIKRSNRWPNDSFFENWTSLNDSITWDCSVGQTGIYKVEIFYTCPKADIGSKVALRFKEQQLVGTISEPHDPPLKGRENDRYERIESYVKEFRRMTLGNIRLEEGAGVLQLRALEIPGSQVMDFRLMLLTRID
ncbi:MAG: N-acetylgalactosamine 6-sulfate sulfatase [Gammaproteobacteria bacterium]|nr:N-acetylgalactosamine 6-sulfate sulfatase [Gammaproteobacteria bacterium]